MGSYIGGEIGKEGEKGRYGEREMGRLPETEIDARV